MDAGITSKLECFLSFCTNKTSPKRECQIRINSNKLPAKQQEFRTG